MRPVIPVDVSAFAIDLFRDLSMEQRELVPGPPGRIDGCTIGIVLMDRDPPHGGEAHPDGDGFLYVMSRRLSVTLESLPGEVLQLGPGDSCIVKRNQWHKVSVIEPATLLHITPCPNGDHRPVGYKSVA